MALTKVSRGLLSTGIVDNSTTTAITIDSSENVGIGTSSPRSVTNYSVVGINGTSGSAIDFELGEALKTSLTQSAGQFEINVVPALPLIFKTSNAERMRIDGASGNITQTGANSADFLIKAPTDNASLTLQAGASDTGAEGAFVNFLQNTTYKWQMGMNTDNSFRWYNYAASSEAMRIDASGNLLVGMTAANGVGGTPADVNGTEIGKGYINLNRDDTASVTQIQFGKNGSHAGRIVTTTTTSYLETSDRRVKSSIADADDCGAAIDSMQVRKFDWVDSGVHHPFGMIAQELLEIAPIAVHAPEDSEEMMGIDYSKLVPMLVKEIQSLRSRVAELENN